MTKIYRIADNIYSPWGTTTADNVEAVLSAEASTLAREGRPPAVEPYCSSEFDWDRMPLKEGMSRLETLLCLSVEQALGQLGGFDVTADDVMFVFSTTKGNVDMLRPGDGFRHDRELLLWDTAEKVCRYFGNRNEPLVVSNACISGISAQIAASRLIGSGRCRYAVVAGADVLSDFIVSGFQAFKALSPVRCVPFDASRRGLNLGEAAACIVYASAAGAEGYVADGVTPIAMLDGAMANDANHISGPSRTGEGLYRTLQDVKPSLEGRTAGFVCCHGTATAYNDEMEAIALGRASLEGVPVFSLKGFFGHTLGAAGVLETVFSMALLRMGKIAPVPLYGQCGVSVPLDVSPQWRTTQADTFIKTISGFGGCNASAVFGFAPLEDGDAPVQVEARDEARVQIVSGRLYVDGRMAAGSDSEGEQALADIYRSLAVSWPKFFKMDCLSKLGFLAAEVLSGKTGALACSEPLPERTAVMIACSHSSLDDDVRYSATLSPGECWPSPALFVYTLPNIVTGEIAIRHKLYGETICYVSGNFREDMMRGFVQDMLGSGRCDAVIWGWADWYDSEGSADLRLTRRSGGDKDNDKENTKNSNNNI